jgi:CDP-glucose 4,6-dehydratase
VGGRCCEVEGLVVHPEFWRRKRVLLTGHTGFKGSWLSRWLAELGADVVGLSDGVPTTPSLYEDADIDRDLDSRAADIRDLQSVRSVMESCRPDVTFHLAAQSLVRRSYREPLLTYSTNVLGTANVLEACRGSVPVVVVVTSDKCYAGPGFERPFVETDPLGGSDPYSSSKACAELVTAAYRNSYSNEETKVASARAGNVIGGGDWAEDRLLADLLRGALSNQPVVIRNPASVRPWQHVLNALEGYLALAERLWDDPSFGEAWNFGPDASDEASVADVVARLTDLWGENIAVEGVDKPQPPEAPALRVDSTKARERLQWEPRWNLEEALRRTVEWAKTCRDGGDVRAAITQQIHAHQAETVVA